MSQEQSKAQPDAQAGKPGEAAAVGSEVGGVRSTDDPNWADLWAMSPEYRRPLRQVARDAACSHALPRSKGAGDGSQEITTPEKLRKLQRALYRKAKAEPSYRFWSLYSELTRRDLLEHALQLVVANGGAPGVDGQSTKSITATPETRDRWLTQLQQELQTKTYRPKPVRRVYIPKSNGGQRPLREMVRGHLNHWTKHRRTADVVTELNRSVRGWSGYFHRLHSTGVFGKLRWWTNDRMRRWLWRKHQCTRALWTDYPDSLLHGRYGLWPLPLRAAWR